MMLSPKARRNISRIIPFGGIYLLASLVYSLLERGLLGSLTTYPATGIPYNFGETIFVTALSAVVMGLMIGTVEILYLYKLFSGLSFAKKILLKTVIYASFIISFLVINTVIYVSIELKTHVFDKVVWGHVWVFFSGYSFWSVELYITAAIGVSLFYTEVSENLGQGVLNNFFTGKYHAPVEEERIFMFLDMKSSTTIAESMGHIKYFEMLREYFSDLTDPIVTHSGKIYQYVGDEIVVSWTPKDGLEDNNCIRCFFAMKSEMQHLAGKYKEKFGLLPEFKAGIHLGSVTTGEIGVVKKDIIFTGDVLNATARIQGLCNSYNVDLLVSGNLMKELDLPAQFQTRALGEVELRGRDEKIELFTIQVPQ